MSSTAMQQGVNKWQQTSLGFAPFPPNRVPTQAETSSQFNLYSCDDEKKELASGQGIRTNTF